MHAKRVPQKVVKYADRSFNFLPIMVIPATGNADRKAQQLPTSIFREMLNAWSKMRNNPAIDKMSANIFQASNFSLSNKAAPNMVKMGKVKCKNSALLIVV